MRLNRPDEVSLLIGIPMTEASFHEAVKTSDWLGRYSDPETAVAYWRDIYLPEILTPVEELVWKAKLLGAEVKEGTLGEVRHATEGCEVVIVLAHWKDSKVEFETLESCLPREAWLNRALQHRTPLARWLASRLEERPVSRLGGWLSALGRSRPVEPVYEVLNDSLKAEFPEEEAATNPTEVRESEVTRAARRREELELIFEGMMKTGNRLELADGLHSKEEFEAAVAPDFSGVMDLANCTSTLLADYLGSRRRHRIRFVQAPTPIQFLGTAPILTTALELLSDGFYSYQEARLRATTLWEEAVCQN